MSGDEVRLAFGHRGKSLDQRAGDFSVVLAAPAQQQGLIGRILEQRMAEGANLARPTLRQHDLGRDQPPQFALDGVAALAGDRGQQCATEFAADHGGDLGHFAGIGPEPVEPGQQRCLQCLGNAGRAERIVGLDDRSGQFLDEQRHALGALQDARHHLVRQRRAAHGADDRGPLPAAEPAQRQRGHLRMPRPVGLEVGSMGDQHHDPSVPDLPQCAAHHLARRRVEPMGVFEDVQNGRLGCEAEELIEQDLEDALGALLDGQVHRIVPLLCRQRQQRPQQRGALAHIVDTLPQQRLQFFEPRLRAV